MAGLELETKKQGRPLLATTAIAAGVVSGVWLLRRQYSQYVAGVVMAPQRATFRARLEDYGLTNAEEVSFRANDGAVLRGRFFPAYAHRGNSGQVATQRARATIILLHGYAASHDAVLDYAAFLVAGGYNVLAYDLRGHGQSDGARTTFGQDETHDVGAAIEFLHARGQQRLGILGISLGATVAILAAAEYTDLAAVVADTPFSDLADAITKAMLISGYPPLVAGFTGKLAVGRIDNLLDSEPGENDPRKAVNWIAPRPLLLIQGGDDRVVDPSGTFAIYDAAGESRDLWITPRTDHTASFANYPREYREKVLAWFGRVFGE